MPSLDPKLTNDEPSTCVAGFAESCDEDDSGVGFVLDFLPGGNVNKRIVLFTGGWAMKFVPVIGKILADLATRGETTPQLSQLIKPMSIDRGVLTTESVIASNKSQQAIQGTNLQRAARFNKIWLAGPP